VHNVKEKMLKAIRKNGIIGWAKIQTSKHALVQDFNQA
jgi:hypothetical protein